MDIQYGNGRNAYLILEDGSAFKGWFLGYEGETSGEVVFNTAMTGYPESLTDPSYRGQILVLTYPLVGNYGVPEDIIIDGLSGNYESEKIHISGLVISDYSYVFSHWKAKMSLSDWLKQHRIPAIYGVDTRQITKMLREKGTMNGKISFYENDSVISNASYRHFVSEVSISERKEYGKGKYRILLIDCGVKHNIIRSLLMRDTTIIRVPWNYNYENEDFDGLFISNGPGDPKECQITIEHIRKSLEDDLPVFGICLGHQLMALASGSDTYKLKYGHRSHNQPVMFIESKKVYVTAQNHGYAVDPKTLSPEWDVFCTNLNDNTNEGLIHKRKPFFSVQFHPEASGGPSDTLFLFDKFIETIKCRKK